MKSFDYYNPLIIIARFEKVRALLDLPCPSVILLFCNLSDENILGTLRAQLLLQFSMVCFETLQMFSAWNEDMHVVWI